MNNLDNQIEEYLDSPRIQALSKSTQDTYRYVLQNVFGGYCNKNETLDMNDIVKDVDNFFNDFCIELEYDKKSGKTIQAYISMVKIMLDRLGYGKVNFTHHIKAPERKKQKIKHLERWFSENEVNQILNYRFKNGYAHRNQLMIKLFLETGARVRELSSVKMSDVILDKRTVMLYTSKTVPRPAFFSEITRTLFALVLNNMIESGKKESDRIFPDTPQCKNIFNQVLNDLGLKNGSDGRGIHTLRHFFCTHLYYVGKMNIDDIARLAGDKNETIRDTYLHPTPDMLKKLVDKAMGWD